MTRLGALVKWLIEHVGHINTTNTRILVTIAAFVATMAVWLLLAFLHAVFPQYIGEWEPSFTVLGFLTAWAGLDTLQFGVKRSTDSGYAAAKSGKPPEAT